MPQLIAVPRETAAGEKRVATVPEVVEKLVKLGFRVAVESGAGDAANFADDTYRAAGAEIIQDAPKLWAGADIVFKVRAPSLSEVAAMRPASGLGAIVRANDTRPEVADQVKSMGAEFVGVEYQEEGTGVGGYAKVMSEGFLKAQAAVFAKQAKEVDIIITTALIPGKPAPKLITAEMVRSMKPGSVIVDMAAEQGGNCELTEPGKAVVKHGVTIIGYADLPSRLAKQSSTLYATNLFRLSEELCKTKDGVFNVNMEDEVIRGTTVVKEGAVTWPPPAPKLSAAPPAKAAAKAMPATTDT